MRLVVFIAAVLLALCGLARADQTLRMVQPGGAYVSIYDVTGNLVDAREGDLQQYSADGPIYYYGECANTLLIGTVSPWCGFNAYECKNALGGPDFANCTFKGSMLTKTDSTLAARCAPTSNTVDGCWGPKVIHNAADNRYLLYYYKFVTFGPNIWYVHGCGTSPTGPCNDTEITTLTAARTSDPGAGQFFIDDDGTAYWLYNDNNSMDIFMEQLDSHYTAGMGLAFSIDTGLTLMEGPFMWKKGSNYYIAAATGCANCPVGSPNPTVLRSTTPLGTYGNSVVINASNTCTSQPLGVTKIVAGGQTTYLLWGDRWSQGNQANLALSSPYFHPLTFTGNDVDVFTCDQTITIAGITASTYPTPSPGYPPVDQGDWQSGQFRDAPLVDASNWVMQTFVPTSANLYGVLLGIGKTTTGCAVGNLCTLANPDGSLKIDLVTVDGSNNPGSTVATVTITAASLGYSGHAQTIVFNATGLTPGNTYGILLKGVNVTRGQFTSAAASPSSSIYPSGLLRNSTNGGSSWGSFANASLMFQTFPSANSVAVVPFGGVAH